MREVLTSPASLAAPHGQVDLEKPSPADARAARNGFSSTSSLDDGAIAVPFNGCTKRQLSRLLHSRSQNQTNPWTCVSACVPSHTPCLLVSTLSDIRAIGSESVLQGRSNLAARGVTCACHAHVRVATTRALCSAHPSQGFPERGPFLANIRPG